MTSIRTRVATTLAGTTLALTGLGVASSALAAPASAAGCNDPVGTPGSIPSLSFAKRDWPLTGGLHMNTYNGNVGRNNGVVDATTHIYNSYWGMGYTGSMMVVLRNTCGELIGVTKPSQWGVDAKSWFWNSNERREHSSTTIPAAVANRVASAEVIHNRVAGTNAKDQYNYLRDLACATLLDSKLVTICPFPRLP